MRRGLQRGLLDVMCEVREKSSHRSFWLCGKAIGGKWRLHGIKREGARIFVHGVWDLREKSAGPARN